MPVTFCGIATIKQSPSLSPSLPQSLSLSLCLGAAELSGSTRADSSAPVPPGGRQKTKRGWTEAVTLQRPLRKRERAQISPGFREEPTSCSPSWTKKEWVSFKRGGRKKYFPMHRLWSLAETFYTFIQLKASDTNGAICLFVFIPTSFLGAFLFPLSVRLSPKREPGYGRRGDTTRKPNIRFYAFASEGTEATGEPSALPPPLPPLLPPLLPLPPVGKSDSGDINAFRK